LSNNIPVVDSEIGIEIAEPIEFSKGHAFLTIKNVMDVEIGFVNSRIPLVNK
jgi:hypothetical protein